MTVLLLAGLVFLSPPSPTKRVYVQADTLRLRAEPSLDAEIVGHLGINTPTVVIERRGEWAKLRLFDQDKSEGWASYRFLADQELSFEVAMESASAGDPITWLERAVAIDGTRREAWENLKKAYLKARRKTDAARVQDMLRGRTPSVYVAVCEDDLIRPLLEVKSDGTLKPLVWGPGTSVNGKLGEESMLEAESDARSLVGVRWFGLSASDETFAIPFSNILRVPRVRRRDDNITGHELMVTVGTCFWRDEKKRYNPVIYATQPVRFASTRAALQEFERAKLIELLTSTEGHSGSDAGNQTRNLSGLAAFRHNTLPQIYEIQASYDQHSPYRRALLGSKRKLIQKSGSVRAFGVSTRWFHLKFAPRAWSISVEGFFPEENGEVGYDIEVLQRDGSVSRLHLQTSVWGC